MYTIYVDDALLFQTGMDDMEHVILSPKLSLDVNGAGSLSFVMPPGHALYDGVKKLKSIITVVEDGETIFRGRVMDDEKDFYNQKDIYCEGDRSFLIDSLCAPYTYTGTIKGLFQKLIDEHNEQVDDEKRFVIGNVTAVEDGDTLETENIAHWDTLKEIDAKLLGAYGGYLRTRMDGDTCYVDWLKQSGDTNTQAIEFSVNLLDLKNKVDAADVFTCLIPLGKSEIGDDGKYKDPVSIASVNGGVKYIQDDEAVALYGKIWRTKTWAYEDDPAKLLEKGRKHLKTGIALQTLTLKAIDMHFAGGDAQPIRIGDHVRILSDPHGLDVTIHCTKMEIDLIDPENTEYIFGEPPRTLTENFIVADESLEGLTGGGGGGGRSVMEELKDYIRWADIRADADEALIELLTGEASLLGERLSKAEITLDGVNAQIVLTASKEEVDELGRRVSSAEIEIDGLNSEISLKADRIDLQGYVTADELSTLEADLAKVTSGTVQASHLYTANLTATNTVRLAGHTCEWMSVKVVTSASISKSYTTVPGGNGVDYVVIGGVSLSTKTETIDYLGT